MSDTAKTKRIAIRVSIEEDLHLKQLAKQAGLSVSEYGRILIFENAEMNKKVTLPTNSKSQFACEHDRELMKLTLKTFILIREMAVKALDEAKYLECAEISITKLKEWKYE